MLVEAGSGGAPPAGGKEGLGGGISLPDAGGDGCTDCAGGAGGGASEPFCGDGLLNTVDEACDDGNNEPEDGCSEACALEEHHVCPIPGEPCVSLEVCGDGLILGNEECDDDNDQPLDGCDSECKLESGWACPFVGVRCVAAECGDGIVAGFEQCDDGDAIEGDGCSDDCRLEEGWKCEMPGQDCEITTCLDGVAEGTEQCDDANYDLGDGCGPFCQREPDCSAGACVSACGDGIVLGDEACDDGNLQNFDGCSSECEIEPGFYCTIPPLADQLTIPLVIRDFQGTDPMPSVGGSPPDYAAPNHVDFELQGTSGNRPDEPNGIEDGQNPHLRIVRSGTAPGPTGRGRDMGTRQDTFVIKHLDGSAIATVSLAGKPVYFDTSCDRTAFPVRPTWLKCTETTMDADSFHTWFLDQDTSGNVVTWPNFLGRGPTSLKTLTLLRGAFAGTGGDAVFAPGGTGFTFDSRYMLIDGSIPDPRPTGLFPIDELGTTGRSCSGNEPHNFHFTSEVRFWFEYDPAVTAQLDFSGDDDVWAYVNGHLALDIGGIHGREASSFTITPDKATLWSLEAGKVYEIAVFQAERNQCASNYWLTLRGFNAQKSECKSECGDGIVASNELCDDGEDNHPTNPPPYGLCGPDCKTRGPFCGDSTVQPDHEECDDGVNRSVYDFTGIGCAPGCKKPPFCGDGKIQSAYERCDEGEENDGRYGGCSSRCQLAPRCGDGVIHPEFDEECDDGPAGSARCRPDCRLNIPQ